MPLDPQVNVIIEMMNAADTPVDFETMTPEQLRAATNLPMSETPEAVGEVWNEQVEGAQPIPVRIYKPAKAAGRLPVMVYFHGGGFVTCGLESHDGLCRRLCNQLGLLVCSVDYRLAPEHKYPAATEDCLTAANWMAENAAKFGADASVLYLGGDSAGGNLAAVVAQIARDQGGPRIAAQLLIYPVTDLSCSQPSYQENAEGYMLTSAAMHKMIEWYVPKGQDLDDPRASPLAAKDCSGLPPAIVLTAEYDPLRDEGEAYAKKLQAAGVPTRLKRYDGMIHGFVNFLGMVDRADQSIENIAAAFDELGLPRA